MKNKLLLILSFALLGIYSCSSDDDKSDVNFIRAKFDGVEQKFNIINVVVTPEMTDPETNYTYKDIIVTATMNSDATKIFVLKSEYNVTGDIIWGMYYTTDETYYENDENFTNSNVTENSNGRYKGTFYGSLNNASGTIVITDGSFDIIYQ
ncbi:MAG TPA: hypothetical protein PLL09_03475 [Flavobacterium sp.]|uniref:hypothetical protein n=1 Tax=unclassified Flavobacterium TaxID=196869 RepID=UPI0025BFC214|nr:MULTISPECIES: hypothetical protein [unclassified Flavobacterium]HRE76866.1 hypothetical protein [Flavobacterium sp.]